MWTATERSLGPSFTPKSIKYLIIWTCCLSLAAALTNELFHYFSILSLQDLLALSWMGYGKSFIWQPLTYFFVQDLAAGGITFSFLITLLFQMFILWNIGAMIVEKVGDKEFLFMYLGSGITAGITSWLAMSLFGQYTTLAGATPPLFALLVVWAMLYSEMNIFLFFFFPVKVKWLAVGAIGAFLLVSLSQAALVNVFFYLTGAFVGYLFGTVKWELYSPFEALRPLDERCIALGRRCSRLTSKFRKRSSVKPKVFDIKTGEPILDDDKFIDEMLAKISRKGQESLTWGERRRMNKISSKKKSEER